MLLWFDRSLPTIGPGFLTSAALAAFLQIFGTALLILLFRMRNFAVGSTYVRSEVIMAAILGTVFFAETIDIYGWTAIFVSVAGVVMISAVRSGIGGLALAASVLNPSAAIGVTAGLCFALSSFHIREASLSFGDPDFIYTAAVTLVTVVTLQTIGLATVILVTRPQDFCVIARHWKPALFVGMTSAFGSIGWFTAMTIERVSYVKALAQVEFLFALMVSILVFRERPSRREFGGMCLTTLGIVTLVVFA